MTIVEGDKFSEYLSYSNGRFTALQDVSLVIVMWVYNNPSSTNEARAAVYVNGNITPQDTVQILEGNHTIYGASGLQNKGGSYRFVSLAQGDYFTLNVTATKGWPVVGAYGYLMPYLNKSLLTKYSD